MRDMRIGVLSQPLHKAGLNPFLDLIDLISPFSKDITIISGNFDSAFLKEYGIDHLKNIHHSAGKFPLFRIPKFLFLQIKIMYYMIKYNKFVDCWFFFSGEVYILPLILVRLLRKPVYCILSSSASKLLFFDTYRIFIAYCAEFSYHLANKIIIVNPRLISEWHLEPYRQKILIGPRHSINIATFTVTTSLSIRPPIIGYIGRLSAEKGILNFVQALPEILSDRKDLHVIICGEGQLKESVMASILTERLQNLVEFPGWISHDDLPRYMNNLQLLVIPSYTEAGPIIMIEAMACGTPVLATPVGEVPETIRDGETGFIMENNSPECIAANVIRALSSPDLDKIAYNGRRFVIKNYTFEKNVEQWRRIMEKL
jgi:glycosyltransferase involved in cell wall biosynthesis